MSEFKVTVEDLETGEKKSMVVSSGDYMLIPFAPCYLHHTQLNVGGFVQLTLKDHAPSAPARAA